MQKLDKNEVSKNYIQKRWNDVSKILEGPKGYLVLRDFRKFLKVIPKPLSEEEIRIEIMNIGKVLFNAAIDCIVEDLKIDSILIPLLTEHIFTNQVTRFDFDIFGGLKEPSSYVSRWEWEARYAINIRLPSGVNKAEAKMILDELFRNRNTIDRPKRLRNRELSTQKAWEVIHAKFKDKKSIVEIVILLDEKYKTQHSEELVRKYLKEIPPYYTF